MKLTEHFEDLAPKLADDLERALDSVRKDFEDRITATVERTVAAAAEEAATLAREAPQAVEAPAAPAAVSLDAADELRLAALDIELVAEYIVKGGDYRRAIDILQVALQLDPDNAAIQAAVEEARANRYMSEERFAQAKKGMTEEEVRNALGQVNLRNIRQFEERGVVAWFYATAEGGPAAAVWFQADKKSGKLKAYQLKYDAVGGKE